MRILELESRCAVIRTVGSNPTLSASAQASQGLAGGELSWKALVCLFSARNLQTRCKTSVGGLKKYDFALRSEPSGMSALPPKANVCSSVQIDVR
jgi:hypothetical protein